MAPRHRSLAAPVRRPTSAQRLRCLFRRGPSERSQRRGHTRVAKGNEALARMRSVLDRVHTNAKDRLARVVRLVSGRCGLTRPQPRTTNARHVTGEGEGADRVELIRGRGFGLPSGASLPSGRSGPCAWAHTSSERKRSARTNAIGSRSRAHGREALARARSVLDHVHTDARVRLARAVRFVLIRIGRG